MSQATVLGLHSENVVTIITPSSTIESPLGPLDTSVTGGPNPLSSGVPAQILLADTNLFMVSGSVTLTLSLSGIVTITVGGFLWSQPIAVGTSTIPFQTLGRGPITLTVSPFTGTASYTYTATLLR